uniref:Uncharacterized protein n=1 Tax=viral metagenome TaxID=1070528 RepID=A0A6C0H4M5_9ZZZZ
MEIDPNFKLENKNFGFFDESRDIMVIFTPILDNKLMYNIYNVLIRKYGYLYIGKTTYKNKCDILVSNENIILEIKDYIPISETDFKIMKIILSQKPKTLKEMDEIIEIIKYMYEKIKNEIKNETKNKVTIASLEFKLREKDNVIMEKNKMITEIKSLIMK